MSKVAEKPSCTEQDLETLKSWANSRTIGARMAERANIVLMPLMVLQMLPQQSHFR
jgi:hypothetical protein